MNIILEPRSDCVGVANNITTINGMDCYTDKGTVYLKLENVARGLNFTRMERSGRLVVDTERIKGYLSAIGVSTKEGLPEFIPEYIFYDLANKAKGSSPRIFATNIEERVIAKMSVG